MSIRLRDRWWFCVVAVALVAWAWGPLGRAEEPDKSPSPSDPAAEAAETPPAEEPAEPDPFEVPDGSPAELVEYVEGLMQAEPPARDPESMLKFRVGFGRAVVEAADKILAGEPNKRQASTAVNHKMRALGMLDRLGEADAVEKLQKLPQELTAAGRDKLARKVETFLLNRRVRTAMDAGPEEIAALVDEVRDHVSKTAPGEDELSLAMDVARVAEYTGQFDQAARAYRELGKLFAQSEEPSIAYYGRMMEGSARRMSLPGNKMKIEGVTLGGDKFDWSKYAGKVVLVQFWATWCGPCRQEIVNVLQNYEDYHQRGFEVVGISIDEDPEALAEFLERNKLPWIVLFDEAEKPEGSIGSMAEYYGVFGVPELILIGKDQKVVALDPRGPRLHEELEKLLGPIEEEKTETEKPTG